MAAMDEDLERALQPPVLPPDDDPGMQMGREALASLRRRGVLSGSPAIDDWMLGSFRATQTITETDPPQFAIRIDKADPYILAGADFLHLAAAGTAEGNWPAWQRNTTLTCCGGITACGDCDRRGDWAGATLRIYGTNRTVVYRIIGRHDEHNYLAMWPD